MVDSNVILDSPDMCDNDIQNDQNAIEYDDERVALANLIANLKLNVDENKKIQKQLKKANASLTQEFKECKSTLEETSRTLGESNSIWDSCLVVLKNKQAEFERYKAFNDCTVDYDKLERKLNETLGLLAQKDIDIKEGLKVKAYEISVVKKKHDELVKQSLLTKSHYEGLVKEKTKVITDLKLKKEKDIAKMISMENQLKFLNEIVYKRCQSIQTIHMLAPKCPTFNGRPTFANLMYLKKTQYEKPCLYEIPHDQSDPANGLVPDREETLTLEREKLVDQAWVKHSRDHFRAPTAKDMEILIRTCLMPHALQTQNDSFAFVHELKQEMHADLKYVESLEDEIDELESDKAEFSNMYDTLLQECVSNDVICSYLHLLSDLDAHTELQHLYLHKVKEYECLAQKLSKQTKFVSKEIQDLKAQLQDKNIAISELKKLIEKCKGKSMETKFDKPSVIRQPKAQRIPKPLVLGKPATFSDSLERESFSQTKSVPKTIMLEGMYQIESRTTQTRAPQLPQTSRNTNPRVSTSTGVIHRTNVSRPQLRSTHIKDKVVPNTSQVKFKKTEVEDHPRISSTSNQTKSVTACNDSFYSRTSNVNAVCATCGKCMFNLNHDACVSKYLNDMNARTKKPKVVPINTRKRKSQVNKSVAIYRKKIVVLESTITNSKSYYRMLYEKTIDFQKSTYIVRDLQGNDLLTGNRGSYLYIISLQETTSSTPNCLMAKASPTQAWLWHRRLSHLNIDYINLLSKKDVVIGLPKLKYVKDQLCSSCEVSKAKRNLFKTKTVPSSKGQLNLLHMDLCGPMQIAGINRKKYILVIVEDYSRYTWTLFLRSKDETPKVLKDFLMMIQRNFQAPVISVRTDRGTKDGENLDKMKAKGDLCILVGHSTQSKGYCVYKKRTRLIVESIHLRFDEIKEMSETSVANDTSGLLDLLFCPLYDDFFNTGTLLVNKSSTPTDNSAQQDTLPSTNIHPTTEPSTLTHVNAEENNNDQAKFTNPFCTPVQEVDESSSPNIGNSNMHTFNQPQDSEYRWTKDHPLTQDRGNPSKPVQIR
ncbi:retrovirus-related pol polyprotein from transposon TNT 1-94 [Tanacetum coccineum]